MFVILTNRQVTVSLILDNWAQMFIMLGAHGKHLIVWQRIEHLYNLCTAYLCSTVVVCNCASPCFWESVRRKLMFHV